MFVHHHHNACPRRCGLLDDVLPFHVFGEGVDNVKAGLRLPTLAILALSRGCDLVACGVSVV